MKLAKELGIAAGLVAGTFSLAAFPQSEIELVGTADASCDQIISVTPVMGENGVMLNKIENKLDCKGALTRIWFDTPNRAGHYYVTLEDPFPWTEENKLFEPGQQVSIKLAVSPLDRALDWAAWEFLELIDPEDGEYTYGEHFGTKKLTVPAKAVTPLSPE